MLSSDFVGTQCFDVSDGTTFQVAFFGQKVIFLIPDIPERFKESISRFPANFKKICVSQIFDLSLDQTSHRAKISHFQNMLGFTQYANMGRICSVLMPVVTLQSFVTIGRFKS